MARYVVVPDDSRVVAITRRAASFSMVAGLDIRGGKNHYIRPEEVPSLLEDGYECLCWFRNPFDRLASTHRLFRHHYGSDEMWASVVLSERNPHWDTQLELHTFEGAFLPTIVHSFDDIGRTWEQELPGWTLGTEHMRRHGVTWDMVAEKLKPDTLAAIEQKYQEDLDYYEELQ